MDIIKFTELDQKIYSYLKQNKKADFDLIISEINEDNDSIRRSLEYLKSIFAINEEIKTIESYVLSDIGKDTLKNGLVEKIFCDYIKNKDIYVNEIKSLSISNLNPNQISLAFGISKKSNLILIENRKIKVNSNYNQKIDENIKALDKIKENKEVSKEFISSFLKRKFILKKTITKKSYFFNQEINYSLEKEKELYLTSDLLKTGKYKNINFKEFDVEKLPKKKIVGRIHPLRQIFYYIKDLYLEMGFKEMSSPYVETSFWPMDSMFISQEHPMRDIQDTFYLPYKGKLPDTDLLEKIKNIHENGGNTGSLGYRYIWDQEKAKELVLRTHTTAATYRKFYELTDKEKYESKYFSIGKVFRNESIDSTHLPEFHQAEGFVIGPDLTLADLIGFIKIFLKKLGLNKIKIKPTYNPYTEPSVEVFAYFKNQKKWIEVVNSGIFRKESLEPYGIKNNVIAWGIGIERIAMLIYNKSSIKEIYGDECDLDWLRNYPIPKRKLE
jgi:phenylalanyl-tRNA synthetase alpha chain